MNGSSPVWHPFTQHAVEPVTTRIVRTEGAYVYEGSGARVFDAISSWWVITHGHRYAPIMQAIREATEWLDQVIFAEYTHAPAEDLARGLIRLAPPGLAHVFYSDSGSTAVEVAFKMALGHFYNIGHPRPKIAVLEHGYHGDTVGTMSAGERGVFNAPYAPLLFQVETLPFPAEGREQDTLDACEQLCKVGDVAALIVEPVVQGAGGMRVYPPAVLRELRRITERYGTLLIADEVMTGWGRTGTLFACEQAGITPDILCTSKGLTGGAIPLAATLCTEEIFLSHLSQDRSRTFFHSSSYTANPIACAAGVANLRVWETEPVLERIAHLASLQSSRLEPFRSNPRFTNVRQCGTITALDLRVTDGGYLSSVKPRLRAHFRASNVLIRPLGNVVYLLPPYGTTGEDLDQAYAAIAEAAEIVGRI